MKTKYPKNCSVKFQLTLIYICVLKGEGGGWNRWEFSGEVSAQAIPEEGEELIIDDITGDSYMGYAKVAKRVHILIRGVVRHHVVLEVFKSVDDIDAAHGMTLKGNKKWVKNTLVPLMKNAGLALAPNDCMYDQDLNDLDRHDYLPTYPPNMEKWRETITRHG